MVVKTLLETGKKVASTLAKKEIEKPVYVLKEGWDKANYKLSKEQSLAENIDAFANRETGKIWFWRGSRSGQHHKRPSRII